MANARKISLVVIFVLLTIVVIVVMQDWRLWQRYLTQPDDITEPANALWFTPRATIAEGAGEALPVAAVSERTLPAAALDEAWAYAEPMGTDALIIAQDGVIQFERYGADFDKETLFQSQSLHKGLTAMALGAAIQQGAIPSADIAAATYLHEWSELEPNSRATLADLAYMQAGLERPQYANHPFSLALQLFMSGDVVGRALTTPFVAQPGEFFIWSNASTLALSIAIERAVGMPWSEFIGAALWTPIGAGEAYVQLDRPAGTAFSSCCLITNARNWLRVGQLLIDDGLVNGERVLPEGWVTTMTTGGKTNPNYGMQLWVNEPYNAEILRNGLPPFSVPRGERLAASDAFYIEGHFAQRLHVVPSSGLVVVRLGDDRLDWDDASLMNPLIRATQARQAQASVPPLSFPKWTFAAEDKAEQPDYTQLTQWAAHPDKRDVADYMPTGLLAAAPPTSAAAFYVSPTTYKGPHWNADVNDPATNRSVDAVLTGQASVLNACCEVYAPRYRQASSAAVFDRTGSGTQAYGLAFADVRAAFEVFLADIDGRPFVLMGHSQGAFHIQRLISEVVMPQNLSDRLVVAYIAGVAVPLAQFDADWAALDVCTAAEQSNCVMSWATFGPDANSQMYQKLVAARFPQFARADGGIDIACTNPLTGSAAPAESAANLGAMRPPVVGAYLEASVAGLVGVACDDGLLRLSATPELSFRNLAMPGENYHFYDIAFFYENLRLDAVRRAQAHAER